MQRVRRSILTFLVAAIPAAALIAGGLTAGAHTATGIVGVCNPASGLYDVTATWTNPPQTLNAEQAPNTTATYLSPKGHDAPQTFKAGAPCKLMPSPSASAVSSPSTSPSPVTTPTPSTLPTAAPPATKPPVTAPKAPVPAAPAAPSKPAVVAPAAPAPASAPELPASGRHATVGGTQV